MRAFARLAAFLSGALILLIGTAVAQVGAAVETGHARTRLVAANMAAAPGEPITLAIVQTLDPDWHVYWRNPGDSGLPLNLTWDLPEGFAAGEVAYPLPHRLSLGPLINFGHEGNPVFLVDVEVPESAVSGTSVPIAVDAEWLICRDLCVPEKAHLSLLLPIEAAQGAPTIGYADKIASARKNQPEPAPFAAAYFDRPDGPVLRLSSPPEGEIEFYPFAPSLIVPSAPTKKKTVDGEVWLGFTKAFAYEERPPERLSGLVVIESNAGRAGYVIHAPKTPHTDDIPAGFGETARSLPRGAKGRWGILLGLAFLGGIVLNAMPCVFPIVFLKAASFAKAAGHDRQIVRTNGLVYTAGVLSAFLFLGVFLLAVRSGGAALGWGFHLQSPVSVAFFVLIIFAIGLNLAGLFEVGSSLQGAGDRLTGRSGALGSFFTGLLAVAVAAPCIGPFLGGAVGVALSQPGLMSVLIFLFIGFGLAAPYLLLSLVPGAAAMLPRPGPWMLIVRQLFAFAMFGTTVWLVWVLSLQTGSNGVLKIGISLVVLALGLWLFGQGQKRGGWSMMALALPALLISAGLAASMRPVATQGPAAMNADGVTQMAFSKEALANERAAGRPVFVDFTAAWCVTCQFNKATVLQSQQVVRAFQAHHVTYMVADWTLQDPEITAALEEQGRAGVPLYLYYAPGEASPRVLPALLTKSMVVSLVGDGR
ncbi:MAG: protein-disulfide reductase DsbD family protein [Parvularcula sp.]